MTSTLNLARFFMNSYRDEEGEWMHPCSACLDFGFLASAALFGGLGIAILILCADKWEWLL